uniref:RING-type domain-containing protein n=1 Tax=Meloidogyne incognita TaxID=6306 RepID=A0A914LJW9_MELIC
MFIIFKLILLILFSLKYTTFYLEATENIDKLNIFLQEILLIEGKTKEIEKEMKEMDNSIDKVIEHVSEYIISCKGLKYVKIKDQEEINESKILARKKIAKLIAQSVPNYRVNLNQISNKNDECPICLENFFKKDKTTPVIVMIGCEHVFHEECLLINVKCFGDNIKENQHFTCPACRMLIKKPKILKKENFLEKNEQVKGQSFEISIEPNLGDIANRLMNTHRRISLQSILKIFNKKCPQCNELLENVTKPITKLYCGHIFHIKCLNEWIGKIKKGKTKYLKCPIKECQAPIMCRELGVKMRNMRMIIVICITDHDRFLMNFRLLNVYI